MSSTVQAGDVRIQVDLDRVIESLDAVSDGAAGSFLRTARATLEGVRDDALPRWPVRTGRSRDSFRVAGTATGDQLQVSLSNDASSSRWGPYAYKIRWSVRTKASIDAEIARRDAQIARGTTAQARAAIARSLRDDVSKRYGKGAPTPALAGKQPWRVLVRDPGTKAGEAMAIELQADLARLAGGT
jgi:hypothetical protein